MIIVIGGSGATWGGASDGRREARRGRNEGTSELLLLMLLKVRGSDTGSVSGPVLERPHKLKGQSRSWMRLKNMKNITNLWRKPFQIVLITGNSTLILNDTLGK